MGVTATILSAAATIGSTAYALSQKPKVPKQAATIPDAPPPPQSDETLLQKQRERRAALSGDSMGGTILTGPRGISPSGGTAGGGATSGPAAPNIGNGNNKKTLLGI